jgi:LexA DNA binding domain
MREPTPRQLEVFAYLFEETRKTGVQPSFREACAAFGFKATHSVTLHLRALAKKGWIRPIGRTRRAHSRSLHFLRTPAGAPFTGFVLPGTMGPDPLVCADHGDPVLRDLSRSAVVIILALRSLRRDPKDPWSDADLMCARRDWDATLKRIVAELPPAYEPNGSAPVKI